jgi:hypothetical protein
MGVENRVATRPCTGEPHALELLTRRMGFDGTVPVLIF